MVSALLMTAMLQAAPTQYAYELWLKNARVGVVVLELQGATYRYGSVHVINRDGEISRRRRGDVFELSAESMSWRGNVPATLALVTMSTEKGCVDVVDEVTRKLGSYCVTAKDGDAVSGKLFDKAVKLTLSDGIATSISFPSDGSLFKRISKPDEPDAPPDLTADGFAVPGTGALFVDPPVDTAAPKLTNVKEKEALEWFEAARTENLVFCIDFARAFAKRAGKQRAAIVHGLRIEDGRAYPHAWVRVVTERGPLELDPTFGVTVNAQGYLPLLYAADVNGEEKAGALWLSFVNGKRRVARRP